MNNIVTYAVGLILLLTGSALSSSSETALTSVNRLKIKQKADEGSRRARILEKLLEHPSNFLGMTLLLNNLFNIAAASVATVIAEKYVAYPAALATGVMTFVILIFCEITPKTYAVQHAEKVSFALAPLFNVLQKLLKPFMRFFIWISNTILLILGAKTLKEGPFVTEDEIKTLVSVGEEEGTIETQEKELIDSIFEFGDTIVREVMVPRMHMVALEQNTTVAEVLDTLIKSGFSRIPVYDKNIDNVVGVLYSRDLLVQCVKDESAKLKEIRTLIKKAFFIPETKRVSELLTEIQKTKIHMAVVVDEYGGTAGLVTIEDLLEEIVGEIFDEYDPEEVFVEEVEKNKFLVAAKTGISEINKMLGIELPETDCETIGGFLVSIFGKIPTVGEKIEYKGLEFTVEKVKQNRLSKIMIVKDEKSQINND